MFPRMPVVAKAIYDAQEMQVTDKERAGFRRAGNPSVINTAASIGAGATAWRDSCGVAGCRASSGSAQR